MSMCIHTEWEYTVSYHSGLRCAFVLWCGVVDSNPYQRSCSGSTVGERGQQNVVGLKSHLHRAALLSSLKRKSCPGCSWLVSFALPFYLVTSSLKQTCVPVDVLYEAMYGYDGPYNRRKDCYHFSPIWPVKYLLKRSSLFMLHYDLTQQKHK